MFNIIAIIVSAMTYLSISNYLQVDPELRPFLEEFKVAAKQRGVVLSDLNIKMQFKPQSNFKAMEKPGVVVLAWCKYTTPRSIEISKEAYDNSNYWRRRLIIFHELGHCLLNLAHEDTIKGGSIMNSNVSDVPYGPSTFKIFDDFLFGSN